MATYMRELSEYVWADLYERVACEHVRDAVKRVLETNASRAKLRFTILQAMEAEGFFVYSKRCQCGLYYNNRAILTFQTFFEAVCKTNVEIIMRRACMGSHNAHLFW